MDTPKALVRPDGSRTLIEIMFDKVADSVDRFVAVVSPTVLQHDSWPNLIEMEVVIQEFPTGMGDAVFCALEQIKESSIIVVLWADQYGITSETIKYSIAAHQSNRGSLPRITIPLIKVKNPYVEYKLFGGRIESIWQSREGQTVAEEGLTDVGLFVLDAGTNLISEWNRHVISGMKGELTDERNFLPFLEWLSKNEWELVTVAAQAEDRLGINTQEDFAKAKEVLKND
jgi:bifunctional N-acetylglucosamine-1-phosphate-uridyltransferase/glucosamine-1-phosphate-acetyltransferase GlmU-like protein